MKRAGIFGPTESGKTTLAMALSREYAVKYRIRSIVLDPHAENWGTHATVFSDEKKFWATVWANRQCLIIADESSETIAREKELIPSFTKLRHNEHRLIVIGHEGVSLLPVMRAQLDTLFLFLQSRTTCKVWVETFADDSLVAATGLKQYEFLYKERFHPPIKRKLIL